MKSLATVTRLAVLVLATLSFIACQPQENAAGTTDKMEGASTTAAGTSGLNVVYIRLDSLQTGYTALASELTRLEENASIAQDNIQKQVAGLEREVRALQNKMQQGLLAPNKVQSEQQRIARKEQEIMQQRDVALGSIQEDQMRLQAEFGEKVKDILEVLQKEKGYDFIFNEGGGSGLLMAAAAHDVTPLVLERLNALPTSDKEMEAPAETEE